MKLPLNQAIAMVAAENAKQLIGVINPRIGFTATEAEQDRKDKAKATTFNSVTDVIAKAKASLAAPQARLSEKTLNRIKEIEREHGI